MQQPAALPQTPAPPAKPQPYVVRVDPPAPATAQELAALKAKRSAISDQLENVSSRRNGLARELQRADPGARAGIENRIKLLDDRILHLEQELETTGDQLANAPLALTSSSAQVPPEFARTVSKDVVPIVAILSVFVLGPFAVAMSRLIWKRANVVARPPQTDAITTQRLEQLQQSVDTIAVEVERISEAQRFVTKLLNERSTVER
ncbi:MAG TPA: hypothetical protein VJ867_16065 [Gemmatimonadaceae bacterium]|nr:hypothetical protein [Gemmatimonadaceae bacterium]